VNLYCAYRTMSTGKTRWIWGAYLYQHS